MNANGLQVGDRVKKPRGYPFDSIVVAVFPKLDGQVRIVCESTVIEGLLHIYSANNMVKVEADE